MTEVIHELTGLVPTFRRPDYLRVTLQTLLAGSAVPALILISEGSSSYDDRCKTSLVVEEFLNNVVEIRLLPAPAFGGLTGNRNHLISFVETTYLLFLDDDAGIHPEFVREALIALKSSGAKIVTAPFGVRYQPQWFTHRGHWRPGRSNEPEGISLSTVMGLSWIFRAVPSDERIVYGYEEADFSFRLYRLDPQVRVVLLDLPTVHRGAGDTIGRTSSEKTQAMEAARCFVTINRYWDRRLRLALFLASEPAHNLFRGRKPFPRSLVDNQWRKALARVVRIPVSSFRLLTPCLNIESVSKPGRRLHR